MDYRMYKGTITAGDNAIKIIAEDAHTYGVPVCSPFKFVAFEADEGTEFTLNNQPIKFEVPSTGKFATPYDGARYMPIHSLVFENDFTGNIYYII